ncbi:FISUMP domain-containing protein [uncultured Fibrobacter sp.]|uniref:FISUMP domain-containing protein n=1 Tax=uncultured Fibrobacter sp. TaxID=261512 RepID=UPI0025F28011|nr:FISUMP domain-containing protein [uncultured Fibrobacter sp.]
MRSFFSAAFFLILLSFAFSACGGDSGTSPNKDSNVSEEASIDKGASSSSDKSSSSSKKDSSSSSSSANKVSSSSKKGNVDASSSSRMAESSSSTGRVEMSHSEVVFDTTRFCTPDYAYCDRDLGADSIHAGAYKQFTDTRNNRKYYYLTINGKDTSNNAASITVMVENLNVGEMIEMVDSTNQVDDSKIERFCYDNDPANCDEYGGLYQWAEAMQLPSRCNFESCVDLIQENHQGICPDGWRLLTHNDFYIVIHANGNKYGVKGTRALSFGGQNSSGYGLIGAGYVWNYKFDYIDKGSHWYYPEEGSFGNRMDSVAVSGYQTRYSTGDGSQSNFKTNAFSVRCVKTEPKDSL